MAQRRMFSKTIIESDDFLSLPASAQCLYFHLCMSADDDGFIDKVQHLRRMLGATAQSLELLIQREYLIPFPSGVVVVRHWLAHNRIKRDRYVPTRYANEKAMIQPDEQDFWNRIDENAAPQGRLGKNRVV